MKRVIFIILIILNSFYIVNGQNNDLLWVSHFTGTGTNQPLSLVTDVSGNIYVYGNYTGTVNIGAFTLTAVAANTDAFIAKYNKNGQVLWLKDIHGTATESAVNIALSNDGNYFFVTGTTNGTSDFDGNTITSAGGLDVYMAKYATDGTFQWVHLAATGAGNQGNGYLAVDPFDNLVMLGTYINSVTFYGGTILNDASASGIRQNYLAKFDGSGNYLWSEQIVDNNAATFAKTVSAYANGYFISGYYNGNLTLPNLAMISSVAANTDGFLYKTDLNGTGQFVRKISGVSGDEIIYRHRTDINGYQFLTGYYGSATLVVDSLAAVSSVKTFPNAGSNDIFYACYAPDGSLQFANRYGAAGDDQGYGIYPNLNHVVIGGKYTSTVNFDAFSLTNSGLTDAYMIETDRNGIVISANKAFGTANEQITAANIDINGLNIFVGEFFSPTLTIGGSTLNIAGANRDMFVARYGTITLSYNNTNVLCNGDLTGAIDLTVSGDGTAPYTYSWTGPSGYTSTSEDNTLLAAGTYDVTVTDAFGATKTGSTIITEPSAIALVLSVTNTKCPASTDGAVDLTVVGGTSPYTYNWTGGITTEDLSGLAAGTYDVTVTDANLCTQTGSAVVANPATMILTTVITAPTCVPGSDGAVDLTVINGTGPYTYLWNDGAASTTQDIGSLISGTYSVTVTDANLCTVSGSYDVINPSAPQVLTTVTGLTCVPGNDGEIDALVSGGTIPYTYAWNDAITTQDRTGLAAGSYSMTVTDAASCQATTATIVLTDPTSPSISFINTDPTCVPGNDGAVDLIVYAGNPPFTYNWTGGVTSEDLSALIEGTYDVTVTDTKGCTVSGSTVLTRQFPAATITASGPTTICDGSSVQLNANTGTGLSYQWQLGGIDIVGAVAGSYIALSAGNYTVVVTGSNGCSTTSVATTITVTALPSATITPAGPTTFCTGGSVQLDANAGVGNTYQWQLNGIDIAGQTAVSYTANASGDYTVVVTNAGCSATSAVTTVTVNTTPTAIVTAGGPVAFCTGGNVVLNVTNTPGCSYQWQESGTDISGATTSSYTANASGSYTVIVTSFNGCVATSAATVVTVSAPPSATITPAGPTTFCTGGSVQLDANAGVGYTYQWQLNGIDIAGQTAVSYTANASGDYTVVVTNVGCSATSAMTTVTVNTAPTATITASGSTTFCQGQSVILLSDVGGGYVYQWQESGVDIAGAVNSAYTANSSGSYVVIVTGLNGCIATSVAEVVTVNPYPVLSFIVTNESCTGTNGAIDLTATGGNLPVSYIWNDAGSSITEDISSLVSGTYTVTVDASGCIVIDSTTVTQIPNLTASMDVHELIIFCASNNNGEATLNIQGGVAPYTYTWSGSASITNTANDLGIGVNFVTVTDFCGTTVTDSVIVTSMPILTASISDSSPANCTTSADGTASISAANGITPYTYTWSGSTSISNIANDLAVGWQFVTISDYCGFIVDSVEITSLPALSLSVSMLTQVSCSGGNNGSASVITTDGVSPFTYIWTSLEINDTAVSLSEGWQYITVTDVCGSLTDSVQITVTTPITIAITNVSPTSCSGGNNGQATVLVTDGALPFTFLWSTNNLFSDTLSLNDTAINLIEAWNYVQVTDACTALIDSVQITSIPLMSTIVTNNILASCLTTSDGTATVSVLNGASPFTFVWSNSASIDSIANDLLPGWQYVTVTDLCGSTTDSVNVSSIPLLSIDLTSLSLITCQGLTNGSALVTTSDGVSPFTFVWSSSETNDTALSLVEGWNYVTVTDFCGSVSDSIDMLVSPIVTATYEKTNGILCFNDTTAGIEITPLNGIIPYSFIWADSPLATFDRTNLGAGKYYFTVTDACNSTYSDSVTINQPGPISLSIITTNVSFIGLSDGSIDLIVSGGTQPYNYYWSNSVIIEDLPQIPEGLYYITVTDNNGCVEIDSTTIITDSWHVEIYNAFSPNGDGKNDVWNIKYISAYPDCEVTMYDEWGIKVFESTGYATAWDGTNRKGNKLPAATYYYIIDLKDGSKVLTGSVTLLK